MSCVIRQNYRKVRVQCILMKMVGKAGDVMTDAEKLIMDRRPIFCKKCGGKLFYKDSGEYHCEDCDAIDYDDFGKIKRYLDEHGPTVAPIIAEETGVDLEIINLYLKNGRLEIPEHSKFYIKCERCGCALRFGRFCYSCTKELAGQLHGAMFESMGEQPKHIATKETGKMHFLENGGKRKK